MVGCRPSAEFNEARQARRAFSFSSAGRNSPPRPPALLVEPVRDQLAQRLERRPRPRRPRRAISTHSCRGPAASIIRPMIERASTLWPSRATLTSASNSAASLTNLAEARACSPRSLMISTVRRALRSLFPGQHVGGHGDVLASGLLGAGDAEPAEARRVRTLASLISIGRFRPAITSALVCSITEMARLEGVPPNMSVSRITPPPSGRRRSRAGEDVRRGAFHVVLRADADGAAPPRCGPTTCSIAEDELLRPAARA